MSFELIEPGIMLVHYRSTDDMLPHAQTGLIAAIEQSCRRGPTALVFNVTGAVSVPLTVPQLWLEVTQRLAPALARIAIASPSVLVRVAAEGFAVSNTLRRVPMSVKSFKSIDEATVWARGAQ